MQWRKVTDELPPEGKDVLLWIERVRLPAPGYLGDISWVSPYLRFGEAPTHWAWLDEITPPPSEVS